MAVSVGELLAYLRLDSAQFDRGIAVAREGMAGAQGSAIRFSAAVGGAEKALANAGRQANVAASGTQKFRAAQLGVTAATERYNTVLANENATIRELALAEKGLITANERLKASSPALAMTQTADAAEMATAKIGGMRTSMAAGIGTIGKLGVGLGGIALLLAGISATKQAVAFQRDMLLVQTQAGASEASIKSLTASVLAMAGQTATAPDKLANSLYHAYSVGLKDKQALDAVKVAAEGAAVGHSDLEETTNAMTAAVASGIPGVENMSKAMGSLLTIVGAGDMKLSDLNDAMGSGILVVAKQFGLSLTDVGAALATFGDNNIRGANAATMLRVSITSMAKPVAGGVKILDDLGLSAQSLADDMTKGGLNPALVDLANHLGAAGITGAKVGEVLTSIFGKKAGPGISVLIDQLQRFQTKTEEIDKGANSFGARLSATMKSPAFQIDKLKVSFETAAISLTGKLAPALASAAHWLSTDLPHALSILQAALGPTEHMIGVGLVGAWHAAGIVLGDAAKGLSVVGHFLAAHATLVKDVVAPVLAMWGAWKAYTIAATAARAVRAAVASMALSAKADLGAMATRLRAIPMLMRGVATESGLAAASLKADLAQIAADDAASAAEVDKAEAKKAAAFLATARASKTASAEEVQAAEAAALAAQEAAIVTQKAAAATALAAEETAAEVTAAGDAAKVGWAGVLGPVGLVAIAATTLFGVLHDGSKSVTEATTAVDGLTTALKADNEALGKNVQAQIEDNLVKDDAYKMARILGLNLETVTKAAMGNTDALKEVKTATDAAKHGSQEHAIAAGILSNAIGDNNKALKTAVQNEKDKAAAEGKSAKSIGQLITANLDATPAQIRLTGAVKDYKAAVKDATSAVLELGQTELAQASSEDAFREGVLNMSAAVKQNGTSLSNQTLKGLANRDMLLGLLQTAHNFADAQTKNHVASATVVKDYAANIQKIEDMAVKLHLSKKAVQDLIAQAHLTPKDIRMEFSADTGPAVAALKEAQRIIAALTAATHYIHLQVKLGGATSNFINSQIASGHAAGGWVNGPGTETSDSVMLPASRDEFVVRASQAKKYGPLLQSINSGTGPATPGAVSITPTPAVASPISTTGGTNGRQLKVVGGELVISRDSLGALHASIRDVVLDEVDHAATLKRMH